MPPYHVSEVFDPNILTKYQKKRIRKTPQFQDALSKARIIVSTGFWQKGISDEAIALDITVGDQLVSRYFVRGKSLVATTWYNRFHSYGTSWNSDATSYLEAIEASENNAEFNVSRLVAIVRENCYAYVRENFKDTETYTFWDWLEDLKEKNKKPLTNDTEVSTL